MTTTETTATRAAERAVLRVRRSRLDALLVEQREEQRAEEYLAEQERLEVETSQDWS